MIGTIGATVGGVIAKRGLKALIKRFGGNKVLERVVSKGGVKEVIDAVATEVGIEPTNSGLKTFATEHPDAFRAAMENAATVGAARWAAFLAETESGRLFVSGARPAALWAGVAILVYAGVLVPFCNWLLQMAGYALSRSDLPALEQPPAIAWETLVWLLPLLYGIRASEGIFGVKKDGL